MKRRNALLDGKQRRPVKRQNKISESLYGSTIVYMKLLVLWSLVLLADHFLEFRFEYLWPFWLFLRSVYDSFKYQGLAFSVFFVCIALTSDMICYLFIPVHWLFFAASTYVWVQYVWHTEKGICLPTVFLWLLFVYVEASMRLKEFKAQIELKNLPFHLDLCRPFAAHCIGYPVVTLGFGFKTYVGYRMRQRRQKEVQKVNEYYYDFLREALPPGPVREEAFNPHPSPNQCIDDRISEGAAVIHPLNSINPANASFAATNGCQNVVGGLPLAGGAATNGGVALSNGGSPPGSGSPILDLKKAERLNNNDHLNGSAADVVRLNTLSNGAAAAVNGELDYMERMREEAGHEAEPAVGTSRKKWVSSGSSGAGGGGGNQRDASRKNRGDANKTQTKEEQLAKMEQDVKRLKIDLQISRNKENELRDQIVSYSSNERTLKSEISNLQVEKSVLETKISNLVSTRAGEKATLSNLEKKLADERRQKTDYQMKLESERKSKKEAANAERAAQQSQNRSEVTKLEGELKMTRAELQTTRERLQVVENEAYILKKMSEQHGDPKSLSIRLDLMTDKNIRIEKSLSSETKLKMDLFSALGDAKRTIGIKEHEITLKDKEIFGLRQRITDLLAVMPTPDAGSAAGKASRAAVNCLNNGTNGIDGGCGTGSGGNAGTAASLSFRGPPSTLSLDLPIATDLSSFSGQNSKMQTALGLANLEDQLLTSDAASGTNSSLYTSTAFARSSDQ